MSSLTLYEIWRSCALMQPQGAFYSRRERNSMCCPEATAVIPGTNSELRPCKFHADSVSKYERQIHVFLKDVWARILTVMGSSGEDLHKEIIDGNIRRYTHVRKQTHLAPKVLLRRLSRWPSASKLRLVVVGHFECATELPSLCMK